MLPIDVASTNVGRVPFLRPSRVAAMVHSVIKSLVVFGLSPNTANGRYPGSLALYILIPKRLQPKALGFVVAEDGRRWRALC